MRRDIKEAMKRVTDRSTMRGDVRHLEEHLEDGESVRELTGAAIEADNGALALTDRRLLFVFHGLVHHKEADMPLAEIESVDLKRGALLSKLTIEGERALPGVEAQLVFKNINKADAVRFTNAMARAVKEARSAAAAPEAGASREAGDALSRYGAGFIQEFLDLDAARRHFANCRRYVDEAAPAFAFAIQLAQGSVRSDWGDENLIWVLFLYPPPSEREFQDFYLEYQRSPLYEPHGSDDYPFNAFRREVYGEAVRSGSMKVLDEHEGANPQDQAP